jgi:hypothetical protein
MATSGGNPSKNPASLSRISAISVASPTSTARSAGRARGSFGPDHRAVATAATTPAGTVATTVRTASVTRPCRCHAEDRAGRSRGGCALVGREPGEPFGDCGWEGHPQTVTPGTASSIGPHSTAPLPPAAACPRIVE